MIELEDIQLLKDILIMQHAGATEAKMIERFIAKYIDPNVTHICGHCAYQIRHAHKRVLTWWEINQAEYNTWRQCSRCDSTFYPSHHKTTICKDCK